MPVCADLAKQTHVATIYFFFFLFSKPMTEVKAYALIIDVSTFGGFFPFRLGC